MAAKAQKGRVALVKAAKATVEAVADVVVIGFTTRQIPGIGRSSKDGVLAATRTCTVSQLRWPTPSIDSIETPHRLKRRLYNTISGVGMVGRSQRPHDRASEGRDA